MASKVSVNSEGLTVPLSLTTYSAKVMKKGTDNRSIMAMAGVIHFKENSFWMSCNERTLMWIQWIKMLVGYLNLTPTSGSPFPKEIQKRVLRIGKTTAFKN